MGNSKSILSIDIGSVSIAMVLMDLDGNVLQSAYVFHKGKVREALLELEREIDLSRVFAIVTPSSGNWFNESVMRFDPQLSIITASKHFYTGVMAILYVGAGGYQLIAFDKDGNYSHSATNTSCAAGTGSFLDQQADRLNLKRIEDLVEVALQNKDELPVIASRCAVFAKTDLVHAQQAGYSKSAICDSLCRGLAKNIVDTLFKESTLDGRIVFAGGVSRNKAVKSHLENLLGKNLETHEFSHLFSAIGAARLYIEDGRRDAEPAGIKAFKNILKEESGQKDYFHPPLSLKLSSYPEFVSEDAWTFVPEVSGHRGEVQTEIFNELNANNLRACFLGIDIGSTSTKAIIIDNKDDPLAGFYSYTAGQPLQAVKAIFESIHSLEEEKALNFGFRGAGTTGSGRKFIGALVGADLIVDEITSHAKAAYQLNPKTDTIIEIGGQDAKFTLLRNGNVTFSQMNSVCAAGTGSFIEEQARKLGIKLADFSDLAVGVKAPLASDRCTVFMERDINHYLNRGYKVREILASTLHSVRENYLQKVAVESSIGDQVCFQGATARNKALVAAFEEKLGREIFVSRYCHLTGALGTALMLREEAPARTKFKGLEIFRQEIPLKSEICSFCNNHCRISIAEVNNEKVAYGFLCGRDYETEKFIDRNTSGFDLLKERNKILRVSPSSYYKKDFTIGLPADLHLFDELSLWKRFFQVLGVKTLSSENFSNPLEQGKRVSGAEFCAPMYAMYGHVTWLSERVNYIFLPVYLESRDKKERNKEENYCYYTQFSPSVVSLINDRVKEKMLIPFLDFKRGNEQIVKVLYQSLHSVLGEEVRLNEVKKAWADATQMVERQRIKLRELYINRIKAVQGIKVVLLGRPYLVLSKSLNKGIPELFGSMGVQTFYQDMVPYGQEDMLDIDYLLKAFPWHFASKILEVTRMIIKTPNIYPVFVTAFKCAPDSFVLEYFKKMLDQQGKPYLILQVDEHDSNVGYETRIEAGVRSFRNHAKMNMAKDLAIKPVLTRPDTVLSKSMTVLFPNWDDITGRFIVANLRRTGFDARLLEHSELSIKKSMVHNTGQCLPLNIIAQEYMDYILKYDLKPENTILWMTEAQLTCNIRMYPQFIKTLLEKHGEGMEKASVYSGELSHLEISVNTTYYAYFCYMLGGLLRRLVTKLRPYEVQKGQTDVALNKSIQIIEQAFLGNETLDNALSWSMKQFEGIKLHEGRKPQVAIFGDLFVRDNDVMNQQLIRTIEKTGGEVINTPYNDYTKITIENVIRRRIAKGRSLEAIGYRTLLSGLKYIEKRYYRYFEPWLGKDHTIDAKKLEKNLKQFNIDLYHSGESYDNILKIFHIIEKYPDVSLFVQTNPAFCCPSLITEAMKNEIHRVTGVPIVTITYDGTSEQKNEVIIPYIKSLKKKMDQADMVKISEKKL